MNWYYWTQANRSKVYAMIIVLAIPVMLFSQSEQLKAFCLGISSASVLYFAGLGIQKIWNRKKMSKE